MLCISGERRMSAFDRTRRSTHRWRTAAKSHDSAFASGSSRPIFAAQGAIFDPQERTVRFSVSHRADAATRGSACGSGFRAERVGDSVGRDGGLFRDRNSAAILIGGQRQRTAKIRVSHHSIVRLELAGSGSLPRQGARQSQISVPSASVKASSTSTPRYRTVLSIFVCPSSI